MNQIKMILRSKVENNIEDTSMESKIRLELDMLVGIKQKMQIHVLQTAEVPGYVIQAFAEEYQKAGRILVERGFNREAVRRVVNGIYYDLQEAAYGDFSNPKQLFAFGALEGW